MTALASSARENLLRGGRAGSPLHAASLAIQRTARTEWRALPEAAVTESLRLRHYTPTCNHCSHLG